MRCDTALPSAQRSRKLWKDVMVMVMVWHGINSNGTPLTIIRGKTVRTNQTTPIIRCARSNCCRYTPQPTKGCNKCEQQLHCPGSRPRGNRHCWEGAHQRGCGSSTGLRPMRSGCLWMARRRSPRVWRGILRSGRYLASYSRQL